MHKEHVDSTNDVVFLFPVGLHRFLPNAAKMP